MNEYERKERERIAVAVKLEKALKEIRELGERMEKALKEAIKKKNERQR